jgi:hypothetical protein
MGRGEAASGGSELLSVKVTDFRLEDRTEIMCAMKY